MWTELTQIFPSLSRSSFPACTRMLEGFWLDYAAALAADADTVPVWMSFTTANSSCGPSQCRNVFMFAGDVAPHQVFAHELGHYFGLGHLEIADQSWDAQKGSAAGWVGAWDLGFFPGTSPSNPHIYFNSASQISVYQYFSNSLGQGLRGLARNDSNDCGVNTTSTPGTGSGQIACIVRYDDSSPYYEIKYHGSAPLEKSISFTSSAADNPPHSYKYGSNVMAYLDLHRDVPDSLSESQALLVRKNIRYETKMVSPYGTFSGLPGHRTRLGDGVASTSQYFLDVDGDALRDLAVWTPPTYPGDIGSMRIALSTKSWSMSPANSLSFAIGNVGDTPFVGDVNGDARDDVVMYQPGAASTNTGAASDASRWAYCLTDAVNPLTTVCPQAVSPVVLGTRGSSPLGVLKMSNAPTANASFVVWNPITQTWSARTPVGSATNFPMPSGLNLSGAVPLPGPYDGDAAIDLVLYAPATAKFHALLSSTSWAAGSMQTRSFSGIFLPSPSSTTAYGRSAGVPVRNMYSRLSGGTPKLGLAMWQAETGVWQAQFDAFSSTPQLLPTSCSYGVPGDIPIGGLDTHFGTQAFSGYRFSSLGIYRGGAGATSPLTYGNGYVFRGPLASTPTGNTSPLGCPGSSSYGDEGGTPSRWIVFPVADMDGDRYPEVIQIDPDTNRVYVYKSFPDYSVILTSFVMGDGRSVFL